MIDIKKISYPDMNCIIRQYPNPEILLGHEIFWQEKRDGTNIGIYLDDDNDLHIRSRHMVNASEDIVKIFMRTEQVQGIKQLLLDEKNEQNNDMVIFGELLIKGKSPTKTELHEKDEIIVFDIYSEKHSGFIPFMLVHQYCYHYNLPIVETYGTSQHITLESLLALRDKMLDVAKDNGREGVVGKTFVKFKKFKYFKEKLDMPKLERKPRHIEEGDIVLPLLPESEILGALSKVMADIGLEKFKDKVIVMPMFARYVNEECSKHNCTYKGNLFKYYKEKLEEGGV